MTFDLALPGVVGRAMHTERPARCRDARSRRLRKELLAIAEQHVALVIRLNLSLHLAVKEAA
jgi:hypothetical protein